MPAPLAETYDLAKQLYLNGLPIFEIAKRVNISANTLYQRKRREKWDCMPRVSKESKDLAIQDVAKRISNQALELSEQIMCKMTKLPLNNLRDCKESASALAAAYATARKALGMDDAGAGSGRVNVTVYQGSVLVSSGDAGDAGQVIDVTCEPSENKAQVVDSVQINPEQTLTDIVRKPTQAVD